MKTKLLICTFILLTLNVFSLTLNSSYSSSITFDIKDSPYYLASNCTISNNAVLTFPAGSEIIAYDYIHIPAQKGKGYKFIINDGAIIANGNSNDSIYFTALSAYLGDYTNGDYWQGIIFNTSAQTNEFSYCSFSYVHNTTSGQCLGGGAITANYNINLDISNSLFRNCTSEGGGGGVYLHDDSYAIIESCVFKYNISLNTDISKGGGGAISAVRWSNALIENCIFLDNSSISPGGAIFIKTHYSGNMSSVSLNNCIFDGNESSSYGGAIACVFSKLLVENNCEFNNNNAEGNGGAIYSYGNRKEISITESAFIGNSTYKNGGAIYLSQSISDDPLINSNKIIINENSFNSNYTYNDYGNGGAICIDGMYYQINAPPNYVNYILDELSINENNFEENNSVNGG